MANPQNIIPKAQETARPHAPDASVAQSRDLDWPNNVSGLNAEILQELHDAALTGERSRCAKVVKEAVASGVAPEELADAYIPELAHRMGALWCSHEIGFATVTIAVSRLQSMLRDLGPHWSSDRSADATAPSVMVIVPQGADHTLGAMVLSGQLRRSGLSVRVMLSVRREEITMRLKRTKFDAVFISSSCGQSLESLRQIVDVVRISTDESPPVVIGGSILDTETKETITTHTRANYATKIPREALELCNLNRIPLEEPQMMRRT